MDLRYILEDLKRCACGQKTPAEFMLDCGCGNVVCESCANKKPPRTCPECHRFYTKGIRSFFYLSAFGLVSDLGKALGPTRRNHSVHPLPTEKNF